MQKAPAADWLPGLSGSEPSVRYGMTLIGLTEPVAFVTNLSTVFVPSQLLEYHMPPVPLLLLTVSPSVCVVPPVMDSCTAAPPSRLTAVIDRSGLVTSSTTLAFAAKSAFIPTTLSEEMALVVIT